MHPTRILALGMGLVMAIGSECAFPREASPERQHIRVWRRTLAHRDSGGGEVDGTVMELRAQIQIEGLAHVLIPEPLDKHNVIRDLQTVYSTSPSIDVLLNTTTRLVQAIEIRAREDYVIVASLLVQPCGSHKM